ncbi:MAG: hypothetical protein M3328_02835 [Chloroflexota bacterium]|nr:hypothetical protein [Chloroflexota bacterium]
MTDTQNLTEKKVIFIQDDDPPLKSGTYTIQVDQALPNTPSPNQFSTSATLYVTGERFTFQPDELSSVFPPDQANGEFEGTLPHVVFNRRTLPWERTSDPSSGISPWLAVLLFDEGEAPTPTPATAKDLVQLGQTITVESSKVTGTGALPKDYLSYPGYEELDYGESPDDKCLIIDIPLDVFNRIAPSKADLPFLAHIREVDSTDTVDGKTNVQQYAIVLGNRVPQNNLPSHAFLVSLENFALYLPDEDGNQSTSITTAPQCIRLVTFRSWTYTANTLSETFQHLLENVNTSTPGILPTTTIQYPFRGTAPTATQVNAALADQASGKLTDAGAQVLVANALLMGYIPLDHHLRHGGNTVSWYRGPLAPFRVAPKQLQVPIGGPDAANYYNPQTGLFDVSYGAAWQLGQLLALQNIGYATDLYNWKKTVQQQDAINAEQKILDSLLEGLTVFTEVFHKRRQSLAATNDAPPAPPESVINWLARLRLLNGVPFNYLVPDESMLPQESLRFFNLDFNWTDALVDGAFSIGRSTTGDVTLDARHVERVRMLVGARAQALRPNPLRLANYVNTSQQITGFMLRSKVVAGWPNLQVNGYLDTEGNNEVPKLRFSPLSNEVMLCLFDGVVQMVAIHEPPEQLHSGVEGDAPNYTTTLRQVAGANPGAQILGSTASVPPRADQQTLKVNVAQGNILTALTSPPISEDVKTFTSAEFALEMVKGVVKVEFQNNG